MNREIILSAIIEEQEKVISNLQETISNYENAADIDEDSTIDTDDLSQQAQSKDMQMRFESLLKDAKNDLIYLKNIIAEQHTQIEKGSIVETDKNILFIGISVPKFRFQDNEVISFSDEAPVFEDIKDKKQGDDMKIGNLSLKIRTIC